MTAYQQEHHKMLKLRQLDVPVERKFKLDDGGELIEMLTQQLYTEDGRFNVNVVSDYDLFSENINFINQMCEQLKKRSLPRFVEYSGNMYMINQENKSDLRDKIDIFEEGDTFVFKTGDKTVLLTVEDAKQIRRKMEIEPQVALKKFAYVSEKISMITNMEQVENFDLSLEWEKA